MSITYWIATYLRTNHRHKARKGSNILARDRIPNPCEAQRTSATVLDGGRRNDNRKPVLEESSGPANSRRGFDDASTY